LLAWKSPRRRRKGRNVVPTFKGAVDNRRALKRRSSSLDACSFHLCHLLQRSISRAAELQAWSVVRRLAPSKRSQGLDFQRGNPSLSPPKACRDQRTGLEPQLRVGRSTQGASSTFGGYCVQQGRKGTAMFSFFWQDQDVTQGSGLGQGEKRERTGGLMLGLSALCTVGFAWAPIA
jgi:hypothetical protein